MRKIEVLGKTWVLLKLHANNPMTPVKSFSSGKYIISIDEEVELELIRLGADFDNPESIHRAITSVLND